MRLTIIPDDKSIGINGYFYTNIQEDLSWIPDNIHAVQWYDTWGEIEYTDGSPNEKIEELGIFQQAVDLYEDIERKVKEEEEKLEIERELARDYWEELRDIRNSLLSNSDWTQSRDVILSNDEDWKIYRQSLRDLPENITDPKVLVLDETHSDWPTKPG